MTPFTKLGLKPSLFVILFSPVDDEHLGTEGSLDVLLQPLPSAWFGAFKKGLRLLALSKPNWANPEGLGKTGMGAWWGGLIWSLANTYLWPQINTLVIIRRHSQVFELPDMRVPSWGELGWALPSCFSSYCKQLSSSQCIKCLFFFFFAFLLLISLFKVA